LDGIFMQPAAPIDHWPAEVLKAAVVDEGELTMEQAQAVQQFIRRIGGLENALLAVDMLLEIESAWSSPPGDEDF